MIDRPPPRPAYTLADHCRQVVPFGQTAAVRSADATVAFFKLIGLEEVRRFDVEAGRFKPLIDKTFPLERAADAHARMDAGEHVGKIVLVTDQ